MKQNIVLSNIRANGWVTKRIDERDANKIVKTDNTGKIHRSLVGIIGEIPLIQNVIEYNISFNDSDFIEPPTIFCSIYSNISTPSYFTSYIVKEVSTIGAVIVLSTPPPNSTDYKLVYMAL